jgi:putative CocE/NonD family hydrolase
MRIRILILLSLFSMLAKSQENIEDASFVKENYFKIDTVIKMRDGIRLYTVIYVPRDQNQQYPFLIERTPYSCAPYGEDNYSDKIGPNINLEKEKYIFVYQDVRGRFMSEGINLEVTPFLPNKKSNQDVDESSDTYDTIDWLLKNIQNNNGRVGLYGISYPGFYATASLPAAHPAIKAVSPQAPVTDEFIGDDVHHNGAFFLLDNVNFMNDFGKKRNGLVEDYRSTIFNGNTKDEFSFFLNMEPLKNTQSPKFFDHESYIWDEYLEHDTYDDYWKARNIRPHLKNITVPTLVVGGWFDAEDLFGALHTYEAIEKQNPQNTNRLVMGPWTHGAWAYDKWAKFGSYNFGSNLNKYFQDSLETKFFDFYLKDKGNFNAAEATVFETGTNQWKSYDTWPPKNIRTEDYFLNTTGKLTLQRANRKSGFNEYVSDPKNPVPYTDGIYRERNNKYMIEDQRFAAKRPDVLSFEGDILKSNVTVTGKILADIFVSTTGTDADFVVKVIDVLPANELLQDMPQHTASIGFQRLVRAEVFRGKFRNSYEKPEPFVPNKISEIKFELNDVAHTFKKGHKIMVQVQSSWFPLVDINPQKFMHIQDANENDFKKATIRIYHDKTNSSKVTLPILNK